MVLHVERGLQHYKKSYYQRHGKVSKIATTAFFYPSWQMQELQAAVGKTKKTKKQCISKCILVQMTDGRLTRITKDIFVTRVHSSRSLKIVKINLS